MHRVERHRWGVLFCAGPARSTGDTPPRRASQKQRSKPAHTQRLPALSRKLCARSYLTYEFTGFVEFLITDHVRPVLIKSDTDVSSQVGEYSGTFKNPAFGNPFIDIAARNQNTYAAECEPGPLPHRARRTDEPAGESDERPALAWISQSV